MELNTTSVVPAVRESLHLFYSIHKVFFTEIEEGKP